MNFNVEIATGWTIAALASLSSPASAGALYFPEMSSASESSYAGAGMVARANDAGTAFSNPAGMTRFKESEILAGATGVYIEANFKPDRNSTTVEGNDGSVNKRIVPAGSFAYVRPVSDRVSLGFSVHNYFGLAIDWKDDWVGRYSSVNVAILAPQFQPSVAYKVNDWLSVGAGAAATLGYLKDKMRVEQVFGEDGNDGKMRLSDSDWAMQYNLAVMIEPTERTRIGVRYLTETDLDFKDAPDISGVNTPDLPDFTPVRDFTTDTDGLDLGVTMPRTIHAAIHHQWNDDLAWLGSVGWEEFSRFGKVQVGLNGTGISTTLDEDFRDVWHFGVGAEYKYKPKWELTGGFSVDSSMSTDRTRPIVIPLGTMYRYAVGFKHNLRDDLTVGGGFSWIWEGNLPVKEAGGVNGKYDRVSISVLSFYARWH
jgi:long-chain fatty acid transport protein